MREMMERAVIPDLVAQAGTAATILSRTLRTWGLAESTLAELLAGELAALDAAGSGAPTIAFLASGIEGIKVRITAKAATRAEAADMLDTEERAIRELLGSVVFGVDDEGMEAAVGKLLVEEGLTLGVAESLTGGLVGSRISEVPGASDWFRGSIVAYASDVKRNLLGSRRWPGGERIRRRGDGPGRGGDPRRRRGAGADRAWPAPPTRMASRSGPSGSAWRSTASRTPDCFAIQETGSRSARWPPSRPWTSCGGR